MATFGENRWLLCLRLGGYFRETRHLVDSLFEEMAACLVAGEEVGIYGFGSFGLRDKAERPGRNPRTREAAPIAARRVVVFRASKVLKKRIAESLSGNGQGCMA